MKKAIIWAALLLGMAHTAFAEQQSVFVHFYRSINPEKGKSVNYAPMRLPIEVIYDSDTHKIEVVGNNDIEAEVFLYDITGSLENYSSTLNTDFNVMSPGTYIIRIQGNGWYAEGKIQVE